MITSKREGEGKIATFYAHFCCSFESAGGILNLRAKMHFSISEPHVGYVARDQIKNSPSMIKNMRNEKFDEKSC